MSTAGRGAAARGLWRAIAGRVAMVLIILLVLVILAPRLSYIEVRVLDFLYSVTPSRTPDPDDIALINIGDPELYKCSCDDGDAPCKIPRDVYAKAVSRLGDWRAKVIVLDLEFKDCCPNKDNDLAAAFSEAGNVIVAATTKLDPEKEEEGPFGLEDLVTFPRGKVWAVGSPLAHQPDGMVRSVPLVVADPDSGQLYEAISLLAFECFRGELPGSAVARGDSVEVAGVTVPVVRQERVCLLPLGGPGGAANATQESIPFKVKKGAPPTRIPEVTTWNAMFINWAGPEGTFKSRAMESVLAIDDEEGRSLFGDKVVMIGGNDPVPIVTPVGKMSGVEMHANALQTLLSRAFIRAVPWWGMIAIMGLFMAVTGEAVRRLRGARAAGAVLLLMVAAAISARQLLAGWGLWMYLFCCDLGIALTWGATSVAESGKMADTLSRFVPSFLQRPGRAVPGQVRTMEASVLYTDIRGYTGIAEQLSAKEVMRVLGRYRAAAEETIVKHGGAIVMTPGDAIVAVFWENAGGRTHATCAVQAGQELLSQLPAVAEAWRAVGARLEIGVGIDAGRVATGLVGIRRLEPTVIGDAVNVAQRLEGLTKTLGCPLIFSESVRDRLPAEIEVIHLDEVTVRNRKMPLQVYGLRGLSAAVLHGDSRGEGAA